MRLRVQHRSNLIIQANLWDYFGRHQTDLMIHGGGSMVDDELGQWFVAYTC